MEGWQLTVRVGHESKLLNWKILDRIPEIALIGVAKVAAFGFVVEFDVQRFKLFELANLSVTSPAKFVPILQLVEIVMGPRELQTSDLIRKFSKWNFVFELSRVPEVFVGVIRKGSDVQEIVRQFSSGENFDNVGQD
jgi:hypothetical protein